MISSILLSLLGGGAGGILRFVPEVIKYFHDQADRDHEYRMTQLQLEIDKARAEQAIDLANVQGIIAEKVEQMKTLGDALKGQSQMIGYTGNWLTDFFIGMTNVLNMLVRPSITYLWLAMYTAVKACVVYQAWQHFVSMDAFIPEVWTADDMGILSMIFMFWFVGRVFTSDHKK